MSQVDRESLRSIKLQLEAFEKEANRNLHIEFPYEDSRHAIKALLEETRHMRSHLEECSDGIEGIARMPIRLARDFLHRAVPLLGFILRSTNGRNAFEMQAPFRRLVGAFLEGDGRPLYLLFSSEWDYSPLNEMEYGEILTNGFCTWEACLARDNQHLRPVFALIGQPATESSNPLVLPLAAHELGHSVWRSIKSKNELLDDVMAEFIRRAEMNTSPEVTNEERQALSWCCAQTEESFCDMLAVRVFGTSYLLAHRYFMAGSVLRSQEYPPGCERARMQVEMCMRHGLRLPKGFVEGFEPEDDKVDGVNHELMRLVDDVRKFFEPRLAEMADRIAQEAGILVPDSQKQEEYLSRLRWFVPITGARSLADILNAAWEAAETEGDFFKDARLEADRLGFLKEVVLKSIEVFEVEERMREYAAKKNS